MSFVGFGGNTFQMVIFFSIVFSLNYLRFNEITPVEYKMGFMTKE